MKKGRGGSERGFTLPELMIVVVLMGILAAIAIPSFFGLVDARRAESAANQLAGDLSLAHSRAANQVGTDWTVTGNANSSTYTMNSSSRSLPSGTKIKTAFTRTFNSSGTVSPGGDIVVSSGGEERTVTVAPNTSQVEVKP